MLQYYRSNGGGGKSWCDIWGPTRPLGLGLLISLTEIRHQKQKSLTSKNGILYQKLENSTPMKIWIRNLNSEIDIKNGRSDTKSRKFDTKEKFDIKNAKFHIKKG